MNPSDTPTDAELIGLITGQRDRQAIDRLIRRYANFVYGVALRQARFDPHQAADISQAVFTILIRRIGSIRSAAALPAWLHRTTCLAARSARRSADRRTHHETAAATAEEAMQTSPIQQSANLELIDLAINSLNTSDRNLILMHYLQGREISEIAMSLGLNEPAARKRITRAVGRMREYFSARGTAVSAVAMSSLLSHSTPTSAPAAVVESSIAAATQVGASAAATLIASTTTKLIIMNQLKLIAIAACAAIAVIGAALVLQTHAQSPVVQSTTQPAPLPLRSKAELLAKLTEEYKLAPGQAIRMIPAPFSDTRNAWVNAEYAYANGAQNVRSAGFRQESNGELTPWYMLYPDMSLNYIMGSLLRLHWYQVEGLDRVDWPAARADFVMRDSATLDQKLSDVAKLIAERTGKRVTFVKTKRSRLCIVLKAMPTGRGYRNSERFDVLILTQEPVDKDKVARWAGAVPPAGWTTTFGFDSAAKSLDAPFLSDTPAGEPDIAGDTTPRIGSKVYILPDAKLDSTAPDYETKLRTILDNLQQQIGGVWDIERRELDIYDLQPTP